MRKIVLAAAAVVPLLVLCGGAALADVPIVPQVPQVTSLIGQLNEVTASGSTASQAVVNAASTTTATSTATATATAAPTATSSPAAVPGEPSIAQLCVATGVQNVDDLLGNVSSSRLVGDLKPLVGIAVPQSDHVTLVDAVQLSDVRKRLNCPDEDKTTATATATPTPKGTSFASCEAAKAAGVKTPMLMGGATYQASLDSDRDGVACEANDFANADTSPLTGGVNTGDGSA